MTAEQDMRKLWEEIPASRCKGRCQQACGPIDMTPLEREILSRHVFGKFPSGSKLLEECLADPQGFHCPLLSPDGKCSAYDDRPTVCRLYGSEETLRCEWGCEPVDGLLTNEEGHEIIQRSMDIGGVP
jgi:uncharacterized protein